MEYISKSKNLNRLRHKGKSFISLPNQSFALGYKDLRHQEILK